MKFSHLSLAFGFAIITGQVIANNIPDLCTDDIKDLFQVKPSECDPEGRVGPTITVGSTVYTNDDAHFVIGSPKGSKSRRLRSRSSASGENENIIVYLVGTTDWPALSSCLLQSVSSVGVTIGLTYGYLSRGDSFRNVRCASLPKIKEQVECLTEQHNDAIYGGTYGADRVYNGAEFWAPVDPRDSISGRLGLLLAKLDKDFPKDGWHNFYEKAEGSYPDSLPTPKWSKMTFMGHSQGAGHAAYLAHKKNINGAVLVSGPQDECIDCPSGTTFWVDHGFKTDTITAFAHGDEPSFPVVSDNWKRMNTWPAPLETVDIADYTNYDVCETPIFTTIVNSDMSPCGGKAHCSTALDDSAPVLKGRGGKDVYIYALDIWSKLADVKKCY